ncbi:MAG: hypothetical protein GTN93_02670, partial [Anaerolineae bacterium]|nr:hypothetical protein [Anaerolineae bacterium]
MNQTHQAEALAQYLDALLQGEESAIPAAVDAEIAALGELGRSLAGIEFRPRPAHQARVEDLLQKHRPTLPSGGATTPHGMWGIPLRWLFVLGALLAGALVFVGVGTLTDVFSRG